MNHIPQPAPSGSSVPTTEIHSTDELPHEPTVSGIGVPGPVPQEVPEHVGQFNTFDQNVMRQWLTLGTFNWSINDEPGKLMYWKPVTPDVNPYLRVLKTLYNAWGGGVKFLIKICATGFHAGQLALVRLPPNVHPETQAGSKGFTFFEYVLMDPKQLEPAELNVRDQRQVAYHYTRLESGSPQSWDIGGWFAVYVMNSLATSSTGATQVQIEVLTKPSEDFAFAQLIPPTIESLDDALNFPVELLNALNFSAFGAKLLASAPREVDYLSSQPGNIQELTQYRYNCFNFGGKSMSSFTDKYSPPGTIPEYSIQSASTGTAVLKPKTVLWDYIKKDQKVLLTTSTSYWTGDIGDFTSNPLALQFNNVNVATGEPQPINGSWVVLGMTFDAQSSNFLVEKDALTPYASNESLMLFEARTAAALKSCQTTEIADILSTGKYKNLFPGNNSVALFQLIKTSDNLPLAYVKWYYDGFFSIQLTTASVRYSLEEIELRFVEFIPRTDALPKRADITQNNWLYQVMTRSS